MTATAPITKEFLLTIDDYYKMAEVGIIPHDAQVELINGKICHMSPVKSFHSSVTDQLFDMLAFELRRKAIIKSQNPIKISADSAPQPDLVVAKYYKHWYRKRHPEPEDIHLIIEVAQSSIQYDTREKLQMYALAGIPEYWVIDLNDYKIHVYRQPEGDKYLFEEIIDDSGIATCETIDFQLNAKEIFG